MYFLSTGTTLRRSWVMTLLISWHAALTWYLLGPVSDSLNVLPLILELNSCVTFFYAMCWNFLVILLDFWEILRLFGYFAIALLTGWYNHHTSSHLNDAAGNFETWVEANLKRWFANQPKIGEDKWCKIGRMKSHLHETTESGRVVVPDGLCIAKCLQDGVGLEDLLLHPCRDVRCHTGGELKVWKCQRGFLFQLKCNLPKCDPAAEDKKIFFSLAINQQRAMWVEKLWRASKKGGGGA